MRSNLCNHKAACSCGRASQGQADGLLAQWQHECAQRAALFDPATEQAALQQWVQTLASLTRPGHQSL